MLLLNFFPINAFREKLFFDPIKYDVAQLSKFLKKLKSISKFLLDSKIFWKFSYFLFNFNKDNN